MRAAKRRGRRSHGHIGQIDGGNVVQFPAPVVRRYLAAGNRRMMQPRLIVVPVRRQIDFENPARSGNVSLKVPGFLLRAVGGYMALDLVGDDSARIRSGRCHRPGAKIIVEDAPLPQRLVVYLLILDGELVTVGANAPGMKEIKLFVFGVAGNNLCILAAPRTQDLKHPPFPLCGPAIGRHGDQPVIEQYHRPGVGRVGRKLGRRGLNDPVRKSIRSKSRVRRRGGQAKQEQSKRRAGQSFIERCPLLRLPLRRPPG